MDASVAAAKNARAGKQQDKVNQSVMSRKSVQTVALSQSVSRSRVGGASRTILSSSKSGRTFANAGDKEKLQPPYRPPVRVVDPETGADVTPLPLLLVDPASVKKNQSNILIDSSQGGTPSEFMSQASIYQTGGGGTVNASMFGGGPFTRSVIGASVAPSEADGLSLSEDHPEQAAAAAPGAAAAVGDLSSLAATMKSDDGRDDPLTDAVLSRRVEIVLSETDTIFLLDLVGTSVSTESAEAPLVNLKNEHYRDVCKTRAGNDLYAERGMNTFNDPLKLKVVQTDKISTSDVAVTATSWDMYDTFDSVKRLQEERDNPGPERGRELSAPSSRPMSTKGGAASAAAAKDESASEDSKGRRSLHQTSTVKGTQISRIVEESEASDSVMSLPVSAAAAAAAAAADASEDSQKEARAQRERELLSSAKLRDDLFVMERVVNVNTYQPKLASYRDFVPIARGGGGDVKADLSAVAISATVTVTTTSSSSAAVAAVVSSTTAAAAGGGGSGPSLERLWCYASPITKGRNVSCCAWNKANPDLIAVGYGQFEFTGQKSGLVCCWSLKNPEHPERLYQCEAGVTAIDFSTRNPNLLAVGTYDGNIAIHNVRAPTASAAAAAAAEPVLDTTDSPGRHTAPVWQLRWVEKDKGERGGGGGGGGGDGHETIVSISADGRVSQWTIRKGFECGDLMKLKRVQMKQQIGGKAKEKKGDALISRLAGGFTFAFSAVDGLMYLAGTEEGYIHKCSCSYNEQYLDTYDGHGGPVYHIQWSPHCPDVFLSCSGDWSVRLWRQDRLKPILSFNSSTKSVNDVCWSPYSSTVFACVNDSAVEVWDLAQSTLDPVISSTSSGAKQTTVTFASNSETILVGDSAGQVTVYQLRGVSAQQVAERAKALEKIIDQSVASQEQMEPPPQPPPAAAAAADAGKKALTGA